MALKHPHGPARSADDLAVQTVFTLEGDRIPDTGCRTPSSRPMWRTRSSTTS